MSTTCSFRGGLADGQVLHLGRTPVMLRVVFDGAGWDALNNLIDEAKPHEAIYVYVAIESTMSSMHVDGVRDGRRFGEWRQTIDYRPWPHETPPDAVLRDNRQWAEWCDSVKSVAMEELKR